MPIVDRLSFDERTRLLASVRAIFLFASVSALLGLLSSSAVVRAQTTDHKQQSQTVFRLSDAHEHTSNSDAVVPATLLQPTPLIFPRTTIASDSPTSTLAPNATSFTGLSGIVSTRSNLDFFRSQAYFGSRDIVTGAEGETLVTSDLGDLLKKSITAPSVSSQARTPIVHDPRIRGSRIGALGASGSHWVPARADLDTVISKFDSRQIESTTVIPGPYSALNGPGFQFIEVELLRSPRYDNGTEWHGVSAADFRSNGGQFFGQQALSIGDNDWGARVNYGYRTGSDYQAGNNQQIPASYESQEITAALGRDWNDHSLEFTLLKLNQADVEFPGYVFDIDDLITDGYELTHTYRGGQIFDEVVTQAWYNRTYFNGNAQNLAKRQFFPTLDLLGYSATTDVDSTSLGYRQNFVRGSLNDGFLLTIGHDLRYIEQELNEVSSGNTLGLPLPFTNRNSPIPKSYTLNPGLFLEAKRDVSDSGSLTIGTRLDFVSADIIDDPSKLTEVGLDFFPASYAEVVGTENYDRNFQLYSAFASYETQVDTLTNTLSLGYSQRAPNITELYAAQPFMLLLQNGLNNVTGDPNLKDEKLFQIDWAIETQRKYLHAGFRGFQSWGFDYLTFENTNTVLVPPVGEPGQVSLRYVNTDFVTISGFESFATLFPEAPLSPFATVRYTRGEDRSRNGKFATSNGSQNNPSQKVIGLARGAFSGVAGANAEPLPGIAPLETRVGIRLRDTSSRNGWMLEVGGRIVDDQARVASSLLESSTPSFATWDVRSLYRPQIDSDILFTCGVENIFDRNYREHLDYRAPGASSVFQPGATFYLGSSLNY